MMERHTRLAGYPPDQAACTSDHPQPVYFPSGQHTLFGWLHRPSDPSDLGVVICNPFGYENLCAHRSLRAFATVYAAAKMPVLRFDYRSTGDSSDAPDGVDQISAWCDDIAAAIAFIRSSCAVRRICLLGVRLGTLLAAQVAARQSIDFLVAVAPVTSGSRYVRELRALQAAVLEPGRGQSASQNSDSEQGMEVAGFSLSQPSVNSLLSIDLAKSRYFSATRTLIVDRDDLAAAKLWAAALEASGNAVQYEIRPGFTSMVSTPHATLIPWAMIEPTARWLESHRVGMAAPTAPSKHVSPVAEVRLEHESGIPLIERAMLVQGEQRLFGILTESVELADKAATPSDAVILLNTGATVHVGPNRMYVDLARRWAARGYLVFRFDLAGLGDSGCRPGQDPNQVYPTHALEDVRSAIEFIKRQRPIRTITAAGLCAGAYHALQAAIHGLPVNTVLCINPLTFHWKQGSRLEDLQISEIVRNPAIYARNARSRQHWAKLMRGQVNLWRAAAVFLSRSALAFEAALRDLCRSVGIPLPNDVGRELQVVTSRGVRVAFFFARDDAGYELLRLKAGTSLKRLRERCRISVLDGADHIFTQRRARAQLIELLTAELTRSASPSAQQPGALRPRVELATNCGAK